MADHSKIEWTDATTDPHKDRRAGKGVRVCADESRPAAGADQTSSLTIRHTERKAAGLAAHAGTGGTSTGEEVHHGAVVQQTSAHQVQPLRRQAVDPRQRVAVALRAVAGDAGRYDVSRDAPAAHGDRDHVVQGCGRTSAAVGAEPVGGLVQHRSRLVADHGDTASSGSRATLCPRAPRGVASTVTGIGVRATQTGVDLVNCEPAVAVAAPRLTAKSRGLSLRLRRPGRATCAVSVTQGPESVASGSVAPEVGPWSPVLASTAPLLGGHACEVLGLRETAECSRPTPRSGCGSHAVHSPVSARPLGDLDGRTWDEYPQAVTDD